MPVQYSVIVVLSKKLECTIRSASVVVVNSDIVGLAPGAYPAKQILLYRYL
jgi:hypothetical protein